MKLNREKNEKVDRNKSRLTFLMETFSNFKNENSKLEKTETINIILLREKRDNNIVRIPPIDFKNDLSTKVLFSR